MTNKGVFIEDRKVIDDEGNEKIVTLLNYDFVAASDEEDEEVVDNTRSASDLFARYPRKRYRRAVHPAVAPAAAAMGNQPTNDDDREEEDDDDTESED